MNDISNKDIFVTGGTGSLGNAFARRRKEEGWKGKMAVYSRDITKQNRMKRLYPDIHFIVGDVRDYDSLVKAMSGYDIVLHFAALKFIPEAEFNSVVTMDINLNGTIAVCEAALQAMIEKVAFTSTDKSCASFNLYGASKFVGEKVVQEYARIQEAVSFHIVRYGNVLESTGSVIEVWKNLIAKGETIQITDPEMTRFFLSPSQAVDYVLMSLEEPPGTITVPKMKALSLAKLAEYGAGTTEWQVVGLRPGEKIHETLLTEWELIQSQNLQRHFRLWPSTNYDFLLPLDNPKEAYSSDTAPQMTEKELMELLNGRGEWHDHKSR